MQPLDLSSVLTDIFSVNSSIVIVVVLLFTAKIIFLLLMKKGKFSKFIDNKNSERRKEELEAEELKPAFLTEFRKNTKVESPTSNTRLYKANKKILSAPNTYIRHGSAAKKTLTIDDYKKYYDAIKVRKDDFKPSEKSEIFYDAHEEKLTDIYMILNPISDEDYEKWSSEYETNKKRPNEAYWKDKEKKIEIEQEHEIRAGQLFDVVYEEYEELNLYDYDGSYIYEAEENKYDFEIVYEGFDDD